MPKAIFLAAFLILSATISSGQCRMEVVNLSPHNFLQVILEPGDPEMDCRAEVTILYRENGNWKQTFGGYLSRVNNPHNRISGVLFDMSDHGSDSFEIKLVDPTTQALNGVILRCAARYEEIRDSSRKYYYVSLNGHGNKFSFNNPGHWKDALSMQDSNMEIRFFPGTYPIREMKFSNRKKLNLVGMNHGPVIFSGLDTNQLTWTPLNADSIIYFTRSTALNPNLVYFDKTRLYPFRSLDEMNRNRIGIGFNSLAQPVEFPANMDGFYRNSSTNPLCNSNWQYPNLLYVKLLDKNGINQKKLEVSAANHALYFEACTLIRVSNIEFRGYGVSPVARAVEINNCNFVKIEGCIFAMNDISVLLSGNSRNIDISSNEFYDGNFSWSAWKIKATYDDYFPYSCSYPYYSRLLERGAINYAHGFSGRYIRIAGNKIHDYAQGGHISPPSVNAQHPDAYDILFMTNKVSRCFEDGFEIDGDARNIYVTNNDFKEINAPLSMAVAKGGPTYIVFNTFSQLKHDTFTTHPDLGLQVTEGHPFKTQYGSYDTSGDVYFYFNSIDARPNHTALDFYSPSVWKNFYVRNNLFVNDSGYLFKIRTSANHLPYMGSNMYYSFTETPNFFLDTSGSTLPGLRFPEIGDYDALFKAKEKWMSASYYDDPLFEPDADLQRSFGPCLPIYGSPVVGNVKYSIDSVEGYNDMKAPDMSSYTWLGAKLPLSIAFSVNEHQNDQPLIIFPNPNTNGFQFDNANNEYHLIQIFDLQGHMVSQFAVQSGINQMNYQLPGGMYIVRAFGRVKSQHAKMIIVK